MAQTSQNVTPISKLKVAFEWLFLVGNVVFWLVLYIWLAQGRGLDRDASPNLLRAITMLLAGGFLLAAGVGSYLVVVFSNCFTLDFTLPVWERLRMKIYIASVFVPLLTALGAGIATSALVSPVLMWLGLVPAMANLLPVLVMMALAVMAQLWLAPWGPLERRLITRRLLAQGVAPEKIERAVLVGISKPLSGHRRQAYLAEEDVGAIWIAPGELSYFGDGEQFSLTPEQVVHMERRGEAGTKTSLGETGFVILTTKRADGTERRIQFHMEGLWSIDQKRRLMNDLGDRILAWRGGRAPGPTA
jgi:hypothetical protein